MKNYLLIICLFLSQVTVQGQAIPNADFENWSNFNYDDAVDWYTSNAFTVPAFSIPTVSPVIGFSGLAARIETYIVGNDTLAGFMSNTPGDILSGEGGVPYTDVPTELTGYYRYDLPGDDTALMVVAFKSGGSLLSLDIFKIKGTGSQSTYVPFTFPLTLLGTPDTVLIACTASNLLTEQGITNGSWIEFDELVFTGPSVTQIIPGGTFDNWINKSIDYPLGWVGTPGGVHQSNDAYSGSYALSLVTDSNSNDIQVAAITSGQSFSEGGYPFTNMDDTLVGYYKYLTTGADTAMGFVNTSFNANQVGGGSYLFLPTSVYTPFAIPINSFMNPDTLKIDFYSSNYPFSTSLNGSNLFIDNLELQSIITGIRDNKVKNNTLFSAYPNPVSDKLTVSYLGQIQELSTFLYNSMGELVFESNTNQNNFEVEMSQLSAGYYWLKLVSGNNVSVRKVVKQ